MAVIDRRATKFVFTAVVVLSGCSGSNSTGGGSPLTPPLRVATTERQIVDNATFGHSHNVCADVRPGYARCHALVRDDLAPGHVVIDRRPAPGPSPSASPTPTAPSGCDNVTGVNGYHPCDLLEAYALASPAVVNGVGETVAIVDAYDNPNAESDLGIYRAKFGLAPRTTTNGCFRKVNQLGVQGSYPAGNTSWGQEISLDVDMVSAICPNCHILLVEANSASWSDLTTAENTAAASANAISNSYGGTDGSTETALDPNYHHPGVAITASSGDSGYGVQYPAASPYVTAVGGTTLTRASSSRGFAETAWSKAGSGCSAYEGPLSWQQSISALSSLCKMRAVADVSAVADPNTGVGWLEFGGTSVASPIVASVYALAENTASVADASYLYAHATTLDINDVTSGSNGSCGNNLCTAASNWDGPTGLGSPNGIAAF